MIIATQSYAPDEPVYRLGSVVGRHVDILDDEIEELAWVRLS
jgi:hypothetical protein